MDTMNRNGNKTVGIWLMLGVVMILVQVVLGGVTRLTQSGLSITNWEVIMGSIPPLNKAGWMEAFNAYKEIPQYEVLNQGMSLQEFKWIYFWEYFHRLWARTMLVVFVIPFVYFIVKQHIKVDQLYKYVIVFLMGALQGTVGWIMVKSGLQERIFVDPVKLMMHLGLAALLMVVVYRLALEQLNPPVVKLYNRNVRRILTALFILTMIQICFGGLVAGSRAALAYPTWPKMGTNWIPQNILGLKPVWTNFLENTATLQLMHRMLAYLLVIFTVYVVFRCSKVKASVNFHRAKYYLLTVIVIQLLVGILTVMHSKIHIPVALGVIHQFTALLFLLITVYLHYSYKYE